MVIRPLLSLTFFYIVRTACIKTAAMTITPSINAAIIADIKVGSPSFSIITPLINTVYAIMARMIATIRA
jgi:hypothetical protein